MSVPTPAKYIKDYENLGFGMFIHWGLYSQIECGEWYFTNYDNVSKQDYMKLADTFTAKDFDAKKIVGPAKDAGCRYATLTTRHHEGFSLYDTCGLNTYDAPHSPAKRDLASKGYEHVVLDNGLYSGIYAFGDVEDEIDTIYWLDDKEAVEFSQNGNWLTVNMIGNSYGKFFGIRVAKAIIKK